MAAPIQGVTLLVDKNRFQVHNVGAVGPTSQTRLLHLQVWWSRFSMGQPVTEADTANAARYWPGFLAGCMVGKRPSLHTARG